MTIHKCSVCYWCDHCGNKYEFGGKDHPYRVAILCIALTAVNLTNSGKELLPIRRAPTARPPPIYQSWRLKITTSLRISYQQKLKSYPPPKNST